MSPALLNSLETNMNFSKSFKGRCGMNQDTTIKGSLQFSKSPKLSKEKY